jgi:hypothetical protein
MIIKHQPSSRPSPEKRLYNHLPRNISPKAIKSQHGLKHNNKLTEKKRKKQMTF